jgi:TonB family protein
LNNRRWSLRSGGEAGSPFADALSQREGEPNSSLRNRDSKSVSRSDEISDRADSGTVAETRQRRTAKAGELALNRPLKTEPASSQLQPIAPSIFDGITPPIGSSTDRFPLVGPNVPGPVAPQSESNARLQAAVLVQRVAPLYPEVAKQNRLEGDIRVSATIGKDGVPTNLNVVSGNPILVPAALAAIKQWRYRPATLDGEPVETSTTVNVSFQLN